MPITRSQASKNKRGRKYRKARVNTKQDYRDMAPNGFNTMACDKTIVQMGLGWQGAMGYAWTKAHGTTYHSFCHSILDGCIDIKQPDVSENETEKTKSDMIDKFITYATTEQDEKDELQFRGHIMGQCMRCVFNLADGSDMIDEKASDYLGFKDMDELRSRVMCLTPIWVSYTSKDDPDAEPKTALKDLIIHFYKEGQKGEPFKGKLKDVDKDTPKIRLCIIPDHDFIAGWCATCGCEPDNEEAKLVGFDPERVDDEDYRARHLQQFAKDFQDACYKLGNIFATACDPTKISDKHGQTWNGKEDDYDRLLRSETLECEQE